MSVASRFCLTNLVIPGSGMHTWTGFQKHNMCSIMQGVEKA